MINEALASSRTFSPSLAPGAWWTTSFGSIANPKTATVISQWIEFYNTKRSPCALAGRALAEAYAIGQPAN